MKQGFVYTGKNTAEISFPLGGIGTGSIGLAGNGRLIDWEIRNRPAKISLNGFSFFAVKAERDGETVMAKVLQGDKAPPYSGEGNGRFEGYGFGPRRGHMTGFPHYRSNEFRGEFPIAGLSFADDGDPLQVKLTAFNPYIPLNERDSSLPAAVLSYEVTNVSDAALDVALTGCLSNPFAKGSINKPFERGDVKGVRLSTASIPGDSPEFGELSLTTDASEWSRQTYWYRGEWFDNVTVFWKDFVRPGRFAERMYDEPRDLDPYRVVEKNYDTCSVCGHARLEPGQSATFRFVISWHFPWAENYWNPPAPGEAGEAKWRNYYAEWLHDSVDAAVYLFEHYERLYGDTQRFRKALFESTLPEAAIEAVSANLSTLKSPTVLRLTDGTLYGFEGCHTDEGSCEGSCTHVWNYETVTSFLFPELARSMRAADYRYNQFEDGKMAFRLMLPLGREKSDYHAAVDGQMGGIVRTYREWKISGDTEWLASLWPAVKKALAYAWQPSNEDGWDLDRDGVMEGAQHHTLDVEMYGPNAYLSGYYHAALLAAARMGQALGDEEAEQFLELYERGRDWIDRHAFNGEYFYQLLHLTDKRYPVNEELGQIKYQIGEGCHIDQAVGQWQARLAGLGDVFDPDKVRRSLKSIYRYNFISMRDHANPNRVYALNDEKGLLICTWPKGGTPTVPVPYADECMTGFEYQAASHMIFEGLVEEGLSVVRAVRERFDGERRNPWNEFECGSHYARAMSSYAILLAMSGFEYDMTVGRIGFSPAAGAGEGAEPFRCFWSLATAWGTVECRTGFIAINVLYGKIELKQLRSRLLTGTGVVWVSGHGENWSCPVADGTAHLGKGIALTEGDRLELTFSEGDTYEHNQRK